MNIYILLEERIGKYFKRHWMPKISAKHEQLEKARGHEDTENKKAGEDYYVNCFGYQTLFILRYMMCAFGIIALLFCMSALTVSSEAWRSVGIFGGFFVLCVALWFLARLQSGFIVYTSEWLYVQRPYKQQTFELSALTAMEVPKKLALVFGSERAVIPLEGAQYMAFMTFMEKNYPAIVAAIPAKVYDKAKRKHASAWGNQL